MEQANNQEDSTVNEMELISLRKLVEFLSKRTRYEIRQMETMHDVRLPSGAIMRGVALSDRLWLGRDLKFYTTRRREWTQAVELSLQEVIHFMDVSDLIFAFEKAKYLSRQRRVRSVMQRASGE